MQGVTFVSCFSVDSVIKLLNIIVWIFCKVLDMHLYLLIYRLCNKGIFVLMFHNPTMDGVEVAVSLGGATGVGASSSSRCDG